MLQHVAGAVLTFDDDDDDDEMVEDVASCLSTLHIAEPTTP